MIIFFRQTNNYFFKCLTLRSSLAYAMVDNYTQARARPQPTIGMHLYYAAVCLTPGSSNTGAQRRSFGKTVVVASKKKNGATLSLKSAKGVLTIFTS